MIILLTGAPHSDKTTVLQKVKETFPGKLYGVLSEAIVEDPLTDRRSAFVAVNQEGKRKTLAQTTFLEGAVHWGKWYVDIHAIDSFIIPEIEWGLANDQGITLIDEISHMEMLSPKFTEFAKTLPLSSGHVLGTIAVDPESWSIPIKSHPNVSLITVTEQNRDKLSDILITIFSNFIDYQNLLSPSQKVKVESLTREYLRNSAWVQINKLYKNALPYVVRERIIAVPGNTSRFRAQGNHGDYEVTYNPTSPELSCTCDLWNGLGKYNISPGVCSHLQAAMILCAM